MGTKYRKNLERDIIQIICMLLYIIGNLYIGYYFYCNYKEEQDNKRIANIFHKKENEIITKLEIEESPSLFEIKTQKMIQLEELQNMIQEKQLNMVTNY